MTGPGAPLGERSEGVPARRLPAAVPQALRFALVGCIGFVADTGMLLLLAQGLGLAPLPARVASFLFAATVTFWLNRRYTFEAGGAAGAQWLRYVLATGVGAFINIGTYWLWISTAGTQAAQLVAGSAIGSLVAMVFNYLVSKALVFGGAPAQAPQRR